jgi:preprotein translocase subunit SecA
LTENWELAELAADLNRVLAVDLPVEQWGREEGIDESALEERIEQAATQLSADKEQRFGADTMHFIERSILIQMLDTVWKEHLYALDHLRQGIGLRAYGQRDPLNEYKSEAFVLFNFMLDELKERVTAMLARVEIAQEQPPPPPMPFASALMQEVHPAPGSGFGAGGDVGELEPAWSEGAVMIGSSRPAAGAIDPANPSTWGTVGRNAACPCGSGKKYKFCHGRIV